MKAHFTTKIFLLLTFFYATTTGKSEMTDYFHDNIKINELSNSSAEKAAIDSVIYCNLCISAHYFILLNFV